MNTPLQRQPTDLVMSNYMLVDRSPIRISDTARRPSTSKPKMRQVPLADAGTVMVERPR